MQYARDSDSVFGEEILGKVRKSKVKLGKKGKVRKVITNACKARVVDRPSKEASMKTL